MLAIVHVLSVTDWVWAKISFASHATETPKLRDTMRTKPLLALLFQWQSSTSESQTTWEHLIQCWIKKKDPFRCLLLMLASSNPFLLNMDVLQLLTWRWNVSRGGERLKGLFALKSSWWRLTVLKECVFGESLTEPILKCGSRADDTANGKRIKRFRRL